MKYLLGILVAAVLGAGTWYYAAHDNGASAAGQSGRQQGKSKEAPLVVVAHVHKKKISDSVDAIGTAEANESVTLTAKVTDTISHINFNDGDYVKAGDVLVRLTNRQEEADLAEAQANLDDAKSSLTRVQDMWAKKLTSKSDLDASRSKAEAAQAHFDSLAAKLQDHIIRAPFSGVLGFRKVSLGTLVQPSTTITTLDDISKIKLDFTVPETYLQAMKPGAPIVAHSESYPNRDFHGIVRTIGTRVDETTRAVPVRAYIPNPDGALKPGMLLTVEVTTSTRNALVVPESAVYQIEDRAYVYRVDGDHVVHEQQIQVGQHRFGIIEVKAGLAEGDLIVTEGIIKLRDGMAVRYEDPEPEVSRSSAAQADHAALSG
ncbi:MAG TPA: efflux RND transporter periplasmic adaptor subunit [Gammaproteobacteria bacterium]|nr:efflux RND transporter periplasmic adaptor subunit [Gammaproteobacteria bacterium]